MLPIEQIDIDAVVDQRFDINDSVQLAKESLEDLDFDFSFEDDKWHFENHLSDGTNTIDFNKVETLNHFSRYKDLPYLKSLIKCWVISLLEDYYPSTVISYYHYLIIGLEKTHLLEPSKIEEFETYVTRETNYHRKTIRQILLSLITFIDFYPDIDLSDKYQDSLSELKNKFGYISDVRELPSSKDILLFNSAVSQYFQKQEWNSEEYLKYAPIYIWWELTNIIPMRPSEFCLIKRDALSRENGKNYIRIPRKKKPKLSSKRNIQVIDTFHISDKLFTFISQYIEFTEPFGKTTTLISYKASATNSGLPKKKNTAKLNLKNFTVLLNSFYKNIVEGQYGYEVNRYLKPNDTRHLAFLNLLMQGIHPVEIARLGGHLSVRSQYHYFQHQEYWVDSEIEKLMLNFERQRQGNEEAKDLGLNDKFKALQKPPTHSGVHKKLKIGYCTDKFQRCKTDICFYCDHWRISKEELLSNQSVIREEINKQRKSIDDLFSFLRNLHSNILREQKELNPILVKEYSDVINRIKAEVTKFARLQHNIKVGGQ